MPSSSDRLTIQLSTLVQLVFTTSSQKKRKTGGEIKRDKDYLSSSSASSSPDVPLPSTEQDPDPALLSFSSAFTTGGLGTPSYVRGDSLAASGVPPRLQTSQNFASGLDYTSSAASSPCAASADLSVEHDRSVDLLDPTANLLAARGLSPLISTAHRALIGGADPQRSSSPLKRRASSMDPDREDSSKVAEDVDMIPVPDVAVDSPSQNADIQSRDTKREMSVDSPDTSRGVVEDSPPTSAPSSVTSNQAPTPPVEQQIKIIGTLVNALAEKAPAVGEEVYLVSRKWLGRAQALGGDNKHASKDALDEPLGPVDNTDILEAIFTDAFGTQFAKLKQGMGMEDFELFPKDAWDLVLSWYGLAEGQIPVTRTAHNTADGVGEVANVQFEFHPPVFVIHRLWSANSPLPIAQEIKQKKPAPPIVVVGRSAKYIGFLKAIKKLAGIEMEQKVRLWRVPPLPSTQELASSTGINTPPDSPAQTIRSAAQFSLPPGRWAEMLLDVQTFLELERDTERVLVEAADQTNNPSYNGKLPINLAGLSQDEALVLDEEISKGVFVSTFVSTAKDRPLASRGMSNTLAPSNRPNTSGSTSPAPPPGPITRGRPQQKPQRVRGCVGLVNLGNTCYMNSALQCVRSVEELTKYFLTGEANKEINPDNPLSHNGHVAKAYSSLLSEIYKMPAPTSITPRHFKTTVGRYAPSFSGYGQQDSQEFVGFLLDGLQEDLNRIKKKPYIEKPDSTDEMINNPAAIKEMADKVWEITKKRDDSVIADLFTGMYKSTLVCPACDKISITFDPFTNLTLPLPVESPWTRAVRFYPLNDKPVEIVVDLDKNSGIKALKQYVADRVGVPADHLFGAEEFRDKFFKFYLDDFSSVGEDITSNDVPALHELEAVPTNIAGPKKQKKQQTVRSMLTPDEPWVDPRTERMLVPVIHRLPGQRKSYGTRSGSLMPPPHFIVLTREEANDEQAIRRKILEKVATYTTLSELHAAAQETDTAENTDSELLNTSSDGDSAGDAQVVAKSVGSEDDMVDVTMSSDKQAGPRLLKAFNKKRPVWINPKHFLDPQFQNIFDLGYFTDASGSAVPTGWHGVTEDSTLPRLSSRMPKPTSSDTEMKSPGNWENSDDGSTNEEDLSPTEASGPSQVTRMTEESSEEDDFPKVKNILARQAKNAVNVRGRNKKMKAHKTYGKKGKKRLAQQQRLARQQQDDDFDTLQPEAASELDDLATDCGPLVRLGEGIVVDWIEPAFDAFFNGDSPKDPKGMREWTNVVRLEDPEIEDKRKQRLMRRKNGITLDDCLAEFEKEEVLSEQDTWYCPRCKEHRRAIKKFDLWKTPDILVVHLKRFSSSGFRRDKLDILVNFPIENLDLAQRVINTEDGKQEVYDLIAVDDHWGGLGGGHYTAFAKNFVDGGWYEYNDSSVYPVTNEDKIISSAAYLLFYRRRSDSPLGGPRFQTIVNSFQDSTAGDESGEGQRLGKGSFRKGSPSASIGAGLVLPQGNRGLASTSTDSNDGELPAYDSTFGPSEANDDWNTPQGTLRNSIEEDEGIGLREYDNDTTGLVTTLPQTWNFENITGNPGSVDDAASDVAQNDNSSPDDAFGDSDEPMMESQPEYPDATFQEGLPQATSIRDDLMTELAKKAWQSKDQVHSIVPDLSQDDASDKVAEIHVTEDKIESS